MGRAAYAPGDLLRGRTDCHRRLQIQLGYNVQFATDAKHKLIVAREVTNAVTDQHQLAPIAERAKAILGVETLDALADRGSYSMEASWRSQSSYPCWSRSNRSPAHRQPRWPGTAVVLYPVCVPSTLKHAKMRST
jgi:hypothetical protein